MKTVQFEDGIEALSLLQDSMTKDQYKSVLANIYLTKIIADFHYSGKQYDRSTVLRMLNLKLRDAGVDGVSYYFLRSKC